ncbi:ribosomal protein L17 [Auriculariales sp. MPI-PUGE-AT-0066]|nr:ribosomal protein L17 [Auriculariales sp. MPI-PUGE-AT-0066]
MKHGVAFRKLSRTASHRMLMLRNLVTSLFEHERIKTTLPKAKEAARLAEQVITLGKKGTVRHMQKAGAFLLKPEMVPKLFNVFAPRYKERLGGYTRIHKYGNRRGDHAPHAILELVDNPHDLKYELAARTVGFELYGRRERGSPLYFDIQHTPEVQKLVEAQKTFEPATARQNPSPLRDYTRLNIKKALRYRSDEDIVTFAKKARDHAARQFLCELCHNSHFSFRNGSWPRRNSRSLLSKYPNPERSRLVR